MTSIKKKTEAFDSLGAILPGVLKTFRQIPDEPMLRVWDIWDGVVGEDVSKNAQPSAFKGNLLLVQVNSSVWIHQLQFLKEDLMFRLNDALGGDFIEDIKFKIGSP